MKNLTHYFKSPKEDETDQKIKNTELPIEVVEEKAPPKKKKISLSKSKKKKNESPEVEQFSPENSHTIHEAQNKMEENSPKKLLGKRNKKRKIEDDSNSSCKKLKTTKSSKINLKKSRMKNKISRDENSQTIQNESSVTKNITPETEDKLSVVLENSLSCDEPLVRINKKSKKTLFEDSDDDAIERQSPPSAGKVENNENSCHITPRNSLFSYFNKVDKETALKQQKSEKIEVKAIVHSSPSGTKIGRQSLDKIRLSSKVKRHKNKLQMDDSDSIEIMSSDEIIDENSSSNVNVPMEAEQDEKSSLSPNVESVQNKPKPCNLASIFMPKKLQVSSCLQSETDTNISLTKAEEILPVEGTKIVQCEKEIKLGKQGKSLSRRKKYAKTSKGSRNDKHSNKIQSVDNVTESNSSFQTTISQQEETEVPSLDKSSTLTKNEFKNTLLTTKKDPVAKLNLPSSKKPVDEKNLLIVENPKVVKSTKKSCEGKTPNKLSNSKLKISNDEELTPKKQGSTLNGYFTPKSNNLTNTNIGSSRKSTKSVKSPWVMKVCLNSASKDQLADSDEDEYKISQDSGKGESEPLSISQEELGKVENGTEENDITPQVVVIDDDDNSSTGVIECNDDGKRRSLPRNAKKPKPNIVEEEEEEIKEVKPQTTKPVKMWPFFQKGGARQVKEEAPIDEEKLKAKMLFLESGVPESIKRKVETVKSDTAVGTPAPFPTVSHVLQADEKTDSGGADSMNLPLLRARSVSPPPDVPAWAPVLPTDPPEESDIPVFERPGNVKAFLEKLKEEEPKTEVKVLYKKLKEYKSKAESDIWTEVYKPTNSGDMVGNSESIKKLKTWLETLKNCRKREGSVSSGDEFVNEDSDGDDNNFNNMAVISGPYGCGKTSAVYAIAKELDIKVLEINASCNRSGKRILAEFSESTQSHHVERSQSNNGFFNQTTEKKKRKKLKISDKLKSEKTSLILVEDADLLFADCDEGFVPALASLAASSKRPIILVTNQLNTPHLDRFNNTKLLRVTFNRPRPNKLSMWLRLVGLVEGVMMESELALRLVTVRNCDVRRCLLELQLMVHSNNSEVKDKLSPSSLWWGWPSQSQLSFELPTLLEPEEEGPRSEVDKKLVLSQLQSAAATSRRLAHLDILSVSSREECLEDHEDPCPVAWAARWRDSTALTPPSALTLYPSQEATWLQQTLASGHEHRTGQTPQEARWLSILRQGEQFFLSGITTTEHTSHQSVTCDYLPMLRELGRSEQVRLANYTRRANRFFNYLQGLGIHASKSYRDFMCDAFS